MHGPRNVYISLLVFAGGLALLFIGVLWLLYVRQDTFIFFPRPNDPGLREAWQDRRVEIRSGEHSLEGWWVDNPQSSNECVILYYGGNAEDVLTTAASTHLDASRTLFMNYRGYGGSTGKPGEKEFFEDALAIYDYVTDKAGVRPEDVVVMGRSLGSGVATMLASERPVRAALLITPFDSLLSVGAEHYSYIPISLLLKHHFASIERAPLLKVPVLILAAENDRIVPPSHAQRLYEAWAGKKDIRVLEGVGHNDIQENLAYYDAINEFLRARCQRKRIEMEIG